MGEWLDVRCRDGQHRIGEAGQLDALALGGELEVGGGGVERPGLSLNDVQRGLGIPAQDPLAETTLLGLVGELDGVGTVRLDGDDGDGLPGDHAREMQAGLEILELGCRWGWGHGRVQGGVTFGVTLENLILEMRDKADFLVCFAKVASQ